MIFFPALRREVAGTPTLLTLVVDRQSNLDVEDMKRIFEGER